VSFFFSSYFLVVFTLHLFQLSLKFTTSIKPYLVYLSYQCFNCLFCFYWITLCEYAKQVSKNFLSTSFLDLSI
jgi:hypothetical protein